MSKLNLRVSKRTVEAGIYVCLFVLIEISFLPRLMEILVSTAYYGFIFFVIFNRWKIFTYVATKNICLLLLILLAIASFSWSENPDSTLEQIKFVLRSTLFGVYLGVEYTPREQIRLLSWVFGIVIILCFAVAFLLPSENLQIINNSVAWKGIFNHKQELGPYLGFAGSTFLINYFDKRSNRWLALIWLGLTFVLVLLSFSKTSLVIFILSLYLMPLYKTIQQGRYRTVLLLIIFSFYISVGILMALNLETILVDWLGKNLEFNGRIPIWTSAIDIALKRPWLGYGYKGFWTSDVSNDIIRHSWASKGFSDGTFIFHSHNAYIDLFLELGVLGLLLFSISFVRALGRITYLTISTRRIESFWAFQFLIIYCFNSFSNGMTILSKNIFWIVYVAIVFSSAIEYSQLKRSLSLSRSAQIKLSS